MKLRFFSVLALGSCGILFAADEKPAVQFKNNNDKVSYSYGVQIATSMKAQGFDVNPDEFANGIRDAIAGKAKLSDAELRETLMAFSREMQTRLNEKRRADSEKSKRAGEEWLATNAKKPGVKTTPSGLQYKVLIEGKGPQPTPADTVSAHYKGTFTDGTEFDSSYTRGQPLTRQVTGLIPGWQEALTNMHVGDKWEIYVPGNLAYGERGYPQSKIGPNATLVFEMELLSINAPQTNAVPAFPSLKTEAGAPQIQVRPAPGANAPIKVQPPRQ
jgi:FKBP-type peptidyl-prolyl cis-trans isomerase FklB